MNEYRVPYHGYSLTLADGREVRLSYGSGLR